MIRLSLLLLLPAVLTSAADKYEVSWKHESPETLRHFSSLLRIDTTNPPGNETKAAEYLRDVLEKEGIQVKLFALDPSRANLVARIRGNGTKKPLLIMGHTDVVGVQRERWSVDPFAAIQKDGFIYGRGALDDKDNVTAALMVMLLLKRNKVALDRDVIFLAEAGEESATQFGIDFMVEQHWSEIEAEYALAEGGYMSSRDGKVRFVEITATEKVVRTTRLIARGTAGHGSRPRVDNAVARLANAVSKVAAWDPPVRLNDITRTYFERLSLVSEPAQAQRYRDLFDSSKRAGVSDYFKQHELGHYSMLRTSISPTIMKAGFRSNVIPSEAEATLDIRALPDEDIAKFYEELRRVIGDPNIEIVPPQRRGRPISQPSRLDSEMFRALERVQKAMFSDAVTVPGMLTGATDMAQLRAKGVQAYGIGPIIAATEGGLHGAHSDDERIQETSLYALVEYLWRAVIEVAASGQ